MQIPADVNNWVRVFRWPCVCWQKFVHRSFEWHKHTRANRFRRCLNKKRAMLMTRIFSSAGRLRREGKYLCWHSHICWARGKFWFTIAPAERVFCCCSCAKGLNTHANQNKIIWAQRKHTLNRCHPISLLVISNQAHTLRSINNSGCCSQIFWTRPRSFQNACGWTCRLIISLWSA